MSRIIALCDGTWCGRETGTKTNVYRLARIIGIPIGDADSDKEHVLRTDTVRARYRHGVGLGSSFLDYLFNGITAQDLQDECIAAYRFIVENYTEGDEVWLFGLSRGAYTVRCVAGMINNCGIVRECATREDTGLLCEEVYRMYRSRYDINRPHAVQSEEFRRRRSWPLIGDEKDGEPRRRPPVRFMGLFDTVGSLGIPSFTGGVGLDWPEFYDNVVSSVVDQVCHFVSLHDRFYIFQPCLARRKDPANMHGIYEEWLPGVHYDLGRQRFRFFRVGAGAFESLLAHWSFASKVIEPNEVLADLALLKMLRSIRQSDANGSVVSASKLTDEMENLQHALTAPYPEVGDGDVYAKVVEYGPFGGLIWPAVKWAFSRANAVWELLVALRDRFIPSDGANVYRFQECDWTVSPTKPVAKLGVVTEHRYPSKTFQRWDLRLGERSEN